ncbi:MAG: SGNH/GDSL hydrolase family protein [Candidatus Daviesbacteria bacterium]|nr:MAG: SGNH/GDSL hydrolase family protein [Candidatus Daviesbacteria bacterium]
MKLRLLVAAGSFLVTLIILELSLRSYYWLSAQQFFHPNPQETTITWQNDPLLGRRLTPKQQGWFVSSTKEYFTWITVNQAGWPDADHSFAKPADTFRIVIIGDSFVENFQVPFHQTFFRQLQDKLNNKLLDKKIEVIALGLGDSGTAQQYLILKNYALIYQPDLVIQFFFSGNDVKNNSLILQGDPHRPYFKLENNQVVLQSFTTKNSLFPQNMLIFFKDHSKLLTLILNFKGQIINRFSTDLNDYPIDYHVYDQNPSADYQAAWELTLRLLLLEKQTAETAGAKFLLVTLANNEQVNKNVWPEIQNTYPKLKTASLDLKKPDEILAEFCQINNLDCLFTLSFFQDFVKQNPATPTHFQKDGHWSQTGTNLVANFLTEKLAPMLEFKR